MDHLCLFYLFIMINKSVLTCWGTNGPHGGIVGIWKQWKVTTFKFSHGFWRVCGAELEHNVWVIFTAKGKRLKWYSDSPAYCVHKTAVTTFVSLMYVMQYSDAGVPQRLAACGGIQNRSHPKSSQCIIWTSHCSQLIQSLLIEARLCLI